jgi:hypothetical protein
VEAASTISSGANIIAPLAMNIIIEICFFILRALKQMKVDMKAHTQAFRSLRILAEVMSLGLSAEESSTAGRVTKRPREVSFSLKLSVPN